MAIKNLNMISIIKYLQYLNDKFLFKKNKIKLNNLF